MIADQTVREKGKGGRSGKPKPPISVDANAAPAVGMVHENQFATVGVGLLQWGELSRLRPEGFVLGACIEDEYEKDEV
jgi:hypothetical protein